ncbi:shikimate kinase [Fervidicella metallireducens AeB]|uniref:Shikimate kinase n=1 Tax=Fervidicella metallireducens AeB TaxID=1403537 RepID=A0A017RYD9_9CLOT|nr:shikimate kinase [Fervidicella metallireducens AeB]
MFLNKNIVLIGMPGCGKTTIGRLLADNLSLPFVDVDEYIEKKTGKSVRQLFSRGEEFFREIETTAIKEISSLSPRVIATGGGVVKKEVNMDILSKNSIIIFINRPIEDIVKDIDADSRPLLKDNLDRIYSLFYERYPLYLKYCDLEIKNDIGIDETINEILDAIKKGYD